MSVVSAQIRSPTASDARACGGARDALEDGEPVVGLVHDQDVALGRLAEVERREHPRQHEHGLGAGPEEGAGDPPVRVERLAEARHGPLDAGQVLEIGRRAEEERRDAFGLEALPEPAPPGGVVEHRASLVPVPRSIRLFRDVLHFDTTLTPARFAVTMHSL